MADESMTIQRDVAQGRLKLSAGTSALKLAALGLVALAAFAVTSTGRTFSGTVDEPAHIAAGMQWLTTNRYDYDLQHPPLGRIAAAVGPYLRGARDAGAPGVYDEGAAILGVGQHYVDTLASARHGELPFLLVLALVVWLWARRLCGDAGAAAATVLLVTNPNILAHAGLATTDIAAAAMTTLALFTAVWWIDRPTWARTILLGIAIGAAIASRLSAIAFVGGPLAAGYALRTWTTRRWRIADDQSVASSLARVVVIPIGALIVIWAVYGFAWQPFATGIERFVLHGSSGHPTYLLGTPSNRGWWYYFPVALVVKTPLPLVFCAILGVIAVTTSLRARRDWAAAMPVVSAIMMLAISLFVRVDLGVRLVLPIYPLLAIAGAQGLMYLLEYHASRAASLIVGGAFASSIVIAIRAHPDNLSYFNALAGDHPEHILVDSNLDWGQDLYRLRDTIAARGIRDTVRVAYFGTADLPAAGVPHARPLGLRERTTGWVAASETYLAGEWVGRAYMWLLDYEPVARIGPSMRLWYIPPANATRDSSPR
jgi:Dolichyl-phosphate-mannose-protein mannosyltransferase